jgi:DNA-binding response OmpR family regulator
MPKVLIAEDDLMIADTAKEILIEQGYEVCGVARTVDEALAFGRLHNPDLAIIDLQLADAGRLGSDIVSRLSGLRRLGILYASANITRAMRSVIEGHACLAKPYSPADLVRSLQIVTEMVTTGVASPSFPRGFKVLPSAPAARRESSYR